MGQWDDKFERAEKKWASSTLKHYTQQERVLPFIIADKARQHPARIAFEFIEGSVSYDQLHRQTNQAANGFSHLGIKANDKVALMLPNCAEFLYSWFGLNTLGATNVPINTAQRGQALIHQLNYADCKGIVIHHEHLDQLASIASQLSTIEFVIILAPAENNPESFQLPNIKCLPFCQFIDQPETSTAIQAKFDDLSTILFTSGTTGPSKGVMLSHHYWYGTWERAVKFSRVTEDDTLYTALPFFHVAAIAMTVGPTILAGAKAVIMRRFSASNMLDDCRKYNCSISAYIGSIIPILMKQDKKNCDADNPIRLMVGAAAPVNIWKDFETRFNTQLLELYGLTECIFSLVNPYESRRPGSCGKPINGYRAKIVDEYDNELPPGTVGEIVTQPEDAFMGTSGYYKMPEASLELMKNFWYHTGDLGYTDEDGYFYFSDRKKQAIRRRGENISSFEVEAVINAHDDVLESCVVGVPSELGEEEVKAVIVLKPGKSLSEEALIHWCEPRMAYFAVPRYIAFRSELPKTPSDRVEKYKLKAEGITPDCWDMEKASIRLKR